MGTAKNMIAFTGRIKNDQAETQGGKQGPPAVMFDASLMHREQESANHTERIDVRPTRLHGRVLKQRCSEARAKQCPCHNGVPYAKPENRVRNASRPRSR